MKTLTVIFDLDGTLTLIDQRCTKAAKDNGKIDWKVFFAPENIQCNPLNINSMKSKKNTNPPSGELYLLRGVP